MKIIDLVKIYQDYISNLEHNVTQLSGNSHRKIRAEVQLECYKEFLNELGQLDVTPPPVAVTKQPTPDPEELWQECNTPAPDLQEFQGQYVMTHADFLKAYSKMVGE